MKYHRFLLDDVCEPKTMPIRYLAHLLKNRPWFPIPFLTVSPNNRRIFLYGAKIFNYMVMFLKSIKIDRIDPMARKTPSTYQGKD